LPIRHDTDVLFKALADHSRRKLLDLLHGTAVKLSITHTIEREPSKFIAAVSGGWPKVISNLKSLLETGSTVLQDPYPTGNQR
jgi:hypothetical protein